MALTPSFSVSQLYTAPENLTITDTSTGSDGSLTSRQIYLRKTDGTYLVPSGTTTDYIVWDIGDSDITIVVLDKDYALDVTVIWLDGSTSVYTANSLEVFTVYSELFLRQLTQAQASNPTLINNANWWANKQKLRALIDDAQQAAALVSDQSVCGYAIQEAKKLTDNPKVFY